MTAPIPMRLHCPSCHGLHVDEGVYMDRPHRSHACQYCGLVWRPADVDTVGVRYLPGTYDADPVPEPTMAGHVSGSAVGPDVPVGTCVCADDHLDGVWRVVGASDAQVHLRRHEGRAPYPTVIIPKDEWGLYGFAAIVLPPGHDDG